MEKIQQLSINVPTDLYERLREYSFRKRISMSKIIRDSVIDFLDKEDV